MAGVTDLAYRLLARECGADVTVTEFTAASGLTRRDTHSWLKVESDPREQPFIPQIFGGAIIIETLFSLEGLGRLGYEAAVARDYPIIFGSLFVFGLIGLVVGILSDLMYVFVDPRIDFERREG